MYSVVVLLLDHVAIEYFQTLSLASHVQGLGTIFILKYTLLSVDIMCVLSEKELIMQG